MVLWGIALRVTFGLHATWLVNSATHMWGSRRFATRDDSRNSWWVALLTFGEGWHNNHHAHPVSARHGLAWYEFDVSWITLKALRAIGIVSDLKVAVRQPMPVEKRRKGGCPSVLPPFRPSGILIWMISGRRRSVIFFTVSAFARVSPSP
jgi:hypothetical protein